MPSIRHVLHALLALFAITFAMAPAQANEVFDRACLLDRDAPILLADAVTADDWNCTHGDKEIRGHHGWLRIAGASLPPGEVLLVGEAVAMDGIGIAMRDTEGAFSTRYLSARDIAANWTTGTRFAYPLELGGTQIDTVYLRVDRPLAGEVLTHIRLLDAASFQMEERSTLLLLGMVLGMMVLTVFASMFLAAALRNRAAWYHFAYSSLLLVYVCCSGSLIYFVLPDITLFQRSMLSYASLAWAVSLIAPFALEFVERPVMTPLVRFLVTMIGLLTFSAGFMLPLGAALGINLRIVYHLLFVPAVAATIVVAGIGLVRGSRFARAFVWVWTIPFVFMIERLTRTLGLYELPTLFDFGLYVALAGEAAAMTVAIAWRVRTLQKERDGALARQQLLVNEARTDKLTGLPNRRDYESWQWHHGQFLALCDLDQFKRLNDEYGHAAGDAALEVVGRVLIGAMEEGLIARAWRIGGEEFALVVDTGPQSRAARVLDDIRQRIPGEIALYLPGMDTTITASMGLVPITGGPIEFDFQDADRLLYSAKIGGRDRLNFRSDEATTRPAPEPGAAPVQPSRSRKVS